MVQRRGLTRKRCRICWGSVTFVSAQVSTRTVSSTFRLGEFGIGALVIYFDAADHVQRFALKTFVYKL
jgi:hypothetical protein